MKSTFPLFLIFFGISCNTPSPPIAVPQSVQTPFNATKRPCELPNWASEDTLFRSPAASFFYNLVPHVGFTQKIQFDRGFLGIIAKSYEGLDGLALGLFQTDSLAQWKQVYCGSMGGAISYKTSMPDLNFDGHKDLLIDATSGGTFGNFAIGFLYRPKHQIFQRDTALNLANLSIDAKNKSLRSRYYGSRYGANIKRLYAWEGDTLVLREEALFHADVDATIWFKRRNVNGTLQQDSMVGKMEPLWKFFIEECVWKGDF
jgi:hypothetical protein